MFGRCLRVNVEKAQPRRLRLWSIAVGGLDGEDFFFFGGEEVVDLLEVFVVEFLG